MYEDGETVVRCAVGVVQGGVLDYFGERRAHRQGVVSRDECEEG